MSGSGSLVIPTAEYVRLRDRLKLKSFIGLGFFNFIKYVLILRMNIMLSILFFDYDGGKNYNRLCILARFNNDDILKLNRLNVTKGHPIHGFNFPSVSKHQSINL